MIRHAVLRTGLWTLVCAGLGGVLIGFLTPKFCAKIAGVKTIQIAPNLAYFLRFEVLETEGGQHDKATRSISDAT